MAKKEDEPIVISADKARGGEIILRRPWQRFAFIGGLVGIILLGFAAVFLWR